MERWVGGHNVMCNVGTMCNGKMCNGKVGGQWHNGHNGCTLETE